MFVGHAMLAFALAAGGARCVGHSRQRSLALGLVAGAFAIVPDVDMLHALSGLSGGGNTPAGVDGFWSASTLVHRLVTHSLLVGVVSAAGFALWSDGISRGRSERSHGAPISRRSIAGLVVLGALVGTAGLVSGSLGLVVMSTFVLAGIAVATAAVRSRSLGPRSVLSMALLGLLSHPFGDLFTGEPPGFFYPLGVQPVPERLMLSADPTIHLLGTFGIELATIWMAAVVYCRLTDRPIRGHVHWRAALGVAYAGAALALPAPTVDSAHRFVFSVLAVGIIGPAPLVRRIYPTSQRSVARRRSNDGSRRHARTRTDDALTTAFTGLAAVTLAGLSFAVTYTVL